MFKSNKYQDISLAEWMAHAPFLLMNQYLGVGMTMLERILSAKIADLTRESCIMD
jgi:hypothetical protein